MARLRVLTLTADYPPRNWSGIGTAVAVQASALSALGVKVGVCVAGRSQLPAPFPVQNPLVVPLARSKFPLNPARYDLIHLHSLALSELAFEIRKRFKLPLIYTAHSLINQELTGCSQADFWNRAQEYVFQHSDHVIFLSSADQRHAVDRIPNLAKRNTVIPSGIPQATRPFGVERNPRTIVFAGRFARSKGVELLAAIISRSADFPLNFVVAGGHGDAYGEGVIARMIERFPGTCRRLGWLDRTALVCLYAQAGVVLVPSLYEPFGLVALEAMQVGAPVLAAAVGGLLDVIGPGSGGRLIESRDPEVWCAAILELVSNQDLRQALERRGPRYVATHFDPARLAGRLVEEVYGRSLRAKTGSARACPVVRSDLSLPQSVEQDLGGCG